MSAFPVDGTWPTGTAEWEKRSTALELPAWDPAICIQCNKCALICPHAAHAHGGVRPGAPRARAGGLHVDDVQGQGARGTDVRRPGGARRLHGLRPLRRVLPGQGQDQPAPQGDRHGRRRRPEAGRARLASRSSATCPRSTAGGCTSTSRAASSSSPSSSSPGACAGCGETPYLKLLSQLFGDRTIIANATGCSSIYGGNLPDDPVAHERARAAGRPGPTRSSRTTPSSGWACGSRVDARRDHARRLLRSLSVAGRRRARRGAPRGRRRPTRRRSRSAAPRWRELRRKLAGIDTARREARCSRRPTTSSGRACGSWAATAGPTTSATAASTTCSRAAWT